MAQGQDFTCEQCQQPTWRDMTFNGLCPACLDKRRCQCGHLIEKHQGERGCTASAHSNIGIRLYCQCMAYQERAPAS